MAYREKTDKECEKCAWFREPDLVDFRECTFPWFDVPKHPEFPAECLEQMARDEQIKC